VGFAAITLCVASQHVFIVVAVYFAINSVRKLSDTLSYLGVTKPGGRFVVISKGKSWDMLLIS
jgi:hypothetical protein